MVTVKEITNPEIVMAMMAEAWPTVVDDSDVSIEDYTPPIDDDNRWFASYEKGQLVAMFFVHRVNLITWQLHIQFRPQYWGKGISTAHSKAILNVIWAEVPLKKLYAIVPEYATYVLDLAKRTGFKQEGRTKKSYQKGGEVYDQIHIGVYR